MRNKPAPGIADSAKQEVRMAIVASAGVVVCQQLHICVLVYAYYEVSGLIQLIKFGAMLRDLREISYRESVYLVNIAVVEETDWLVSSS